jgi:hypothetical protein
MSTALGLGLWCLTPLSTIFELYRGGQFYWWRKLEYPEKNIDLPQYLVKVIPEVSWELNLLSKFLLYCLSIYTIVLDL